MIPPCRPVAVLRGHTGNVERVAVSPDGSMVFTACNRDSTIRIWDTGSQECTHVLAVDVRPNCWAVSPNGRTLYLGQEKQLTVRDIESKRVINSFQHSGVVSCVAVSPDGALLYSVDYFFEWEGYLCVWDTHSLECLRRLQAGGIVSIEVSADGSTVYTLAKTKNFSIWKTELRRRVASFDGKTSEIRCIVASRKADVGYSAGDERSIRFWDTKSRKCIAKIEEAHKDTVYCLALSPNDATLYSSSKDRTIRLWDTHSRECLCVLSGHSDQIFSLALSPDGLSLFSGSADTTVRIWKINAGPSSTTLQAHSTFTYCLALSADNKHLFSGGADKMIHQWCVTSSKSIADFHGHSGAVLSIALSASGNLLASGSQDESIRVWNVATKETVAVLQDSASVLSVIFSTDDDTVMTGNAGGSIDVWNVKSQERVKKSIFRGTPVSAMTFSRRLGRLFSPCGEKLLVWFSISDKTPARLLKGHTSWITCLTLSPSEDIVASGSDDGTIRLWDADSLYRIATLARESGSPPLFSVVFHRYNNSTQDILFSGDRSGTICQWNIDAKVCEATISTRQSALTDMVVSSDGDLIFSADSDGTIRCSVLSSMIRHDGHRCNPSHSLPLPTDIE